MEQNYNNVQNGGVPAQLEKMVGDAFGKCLAACIMAWFPIASIIAIVMGSQGLNLVKDANTLAAGLGISAGGKAVGAKITGMIGKIGGIVMTVFYGLYFFIFFFAILGAL